MWEIQFSQEAANYAIDSHPYNEQVLIAVETLALLPSGLPISDCELFEEPSTYLWSIADHEVIYEQFIDDHLLYIWMIRPL